MENEEYMEVLSYMAVKYIIYKDSSIGENDYWNAIDPCKRNRSLAKPKMDLIITPLYQGDYFTTINNCCGRRMDFCSCK